MKKSMLGRTIGLVAVIVLIAGLMGCTAKSDVSGKWKGTMTLAAGGKTMTDLEFDLVQRSQDLSGAMIFTKVEGGRMKLTGSRTGDELKFSTEHQKGLTVHFTGSLTSGSRIAGTAILVYSDPKVPVKEDKVALELTR